MFKEVEIKSLKAMFFTFFLFSFAIADKFDKCLWIQSDSMKEKESITNALFFAYEYEFDSVFLQVRSRGDAFYNSEIVPKNNFIEEDFDPLDYAITLGHSLGIEVHAWVNVYILWSSTYKPYSLNHLYYHYPDWLEVNVHGKSDANVDITVPQSKNWEGIFLSPNNPKVNSYLESVFFEIIENYCCKPLTNVEGRG